MDTGRGLSTSTAASTNGESGGVDLNSDDSNENLSQESHGQQVSAKEFVLTPELDGFIKRTLVPLLVDRYIEKIKKQSKEEAGIRAHPTSPPPAQ